MVDRRINEAINASLRRAYSACTEDYLAEWRRAFSCETTPERINEFGIIDPQRYDTDRGILFICRETNGWSDETYQKQLLFRAWMEEITQKGLAGRDHIRIHPNMWYNIGRWVTLIEDPALPLADIVGMKDAAIRAIGRIAFTNVNKVRGYNSSRTEYNRIARSAVAETLLQTEIEIIAPKIIVCCGTSKTVLCCIPHYSGKIIQMPHPGARKRTCTMLAELKRQL